MHKYTWKHMYMHMYTFTHTDALYICRRMGKLSFIVYNRTLQINATRYTGITSINTENFIN